jgi:hypothetical protein
MHALPYKARNLSVIFIHYFIWQTTVKTDREALLLARKEVDVEVNTEKNTVLYGRISPRECVKNHKIKAGNK